MAPKMLRPSRSSISIRTRSPKDRNGVTASPVSSASTVRLSAKHEAPVDVSWLAIVPEPTSAALLGLAAAFALRRRSR